VAKFTRCQRVSAVYCRIQSGSTGFALVVLVLTSKEQKDVGIGVGQPCDMFDQSSKVGHFERRRRHTGAHRSESAALALELPEFRASCVSASD